MAIKRIHEVPTDLPHAHLYLDDLEEISRIFLKAFAAFPARVGDEAKITYTVGDLQMDSLDDLKVHGGSTTDLRIDVRGPGLFFRSYIQFKILINPQIGLHALGEQASWEVYARIKAIFDHRQLRIKNAIWSLPGKSKILLCGMASVVPYLVLLTRPGPRGLWILYGWMSFLVLLGFTLYRPSRVFFVRSHESSRMSSTARRGYARDIIFLALGALIVKLIERLMSHLFK